MIENKDTIAFIVEGEAREPLIIQNISNIYFKHSNFQIITLPAGQNIYMLWQTLQEDDFETDIIEVLRESSKELQKILAPYTRDNFSEVYLFFDYDGHQNNLTTEERSLDTVMRMLEDFDNETENGKLYISYPMVEALRDFYPQQCGSQTGCFCQLCEFANYKDTSASGECYTDFRKYSFEIWQMLISTFIMKVSCLLEQEKCISFEEYRMKVTPITIYEYQNTYINLDQIFILSAFPEFLLDYFKQDFWNKTVQYASLRPYHCQKEDVKNEM